MSTRHAFTLVELLMIVAILVTLLGFVYIEFDPFQRKGQAYDAERDIHTRQIYKSINDYLWDQNYPPPTFPDEGEEKWICDEGVTGAGCTDPPINGVDLSFLVTDDYIEHVPADPVYANAQKTGFVLTRQGDYFTASAPYKMVYEPLPDPIAWWKLDEIDTSDTAAEQIGGINGIYYNMPAGAPSTDIPWSGFLNMRSLEFDGGNDYIEVTDDDVFDLTNMISVSAWVKGDTWGAGSNANIILRHGASCNVVWEFAITNNGKATLILDGCEGGANSYEGDTTLATGTWYHVAGVWDGSNAHIYVDEALDNSPSAAAHAAPIGTTTESVYIGGRQDGGGTADKFDGKIDEVRLFDVALTQEQIRWLANGLF